MPAAELRQKGKKLDEITSNGIKLLKAASGCEKDSLEQIEILVANGVNINFASPDSGVTALHLAAINDDTEIIRVLIEKNADLWAKNKSGETPLEMAARVNNNVEPVVMLLKAQAFECVIEKVVFIAAKHRNIELLCALLKQGFSFNINTVFPNGETLLGIFVKQRNASAIYRLKEVSDSYELGLDLDQRVPAQHKQRPIVLAIKNKDIEVTRELADAGADLSIDSNFPAHLAVFNGMFKIVELLHEQGVAMDKDSDCETPIHTAVESNQLEILKFFRTKGLNLDVYHNVDGRSVGTPLCRAIFKRNHGLVTWLLEEGGVSFNGPGYEYSENEHSPVIAAIMSDNLQALKQLAN